MENNTQLPVEVQKEINEQADKYGFVVPYDGSNKFYNDDKVEGYKAGATAYATKLHDAQKENADLKRWKQEAIQLLAPIIEYGQGHKDAQLGRSCTEFVLQRAKLYDTLKAQQGPRWVKASDFKYEIGMPYHAKDSSFKGAGHFNSNGAFIWGDCTVTHPKDQDELYILDESAAGREEDNAVEFAEWVREQNYKPYAGSWYLNGNNYAHQPHSTAQLYELFKQQNEK